MRYLLFALSAILALQATASKAQDAEAARLVNEIIDATGGIKRTQEVIPVIQEHVARAIVAVNPDKGPEINKFVSEDFMPILLSRLSEMRPEIIALYVRTFSIEEIRFMHANATSPIGRSIAQKQTAMVRESLQLSQAFVARIASESIQQLEPKLRERGLKL